MQPHVPSGRGADAEQPTFVVEPHEILKSTLLTVSPLEDTLADSASLVDVTVAPASGAAQELAIDGTADGGAEAVALAVATALGTGANWLAPEGAADATPVAEAVAAGVGAGIGLHPATIDAAIRKEANPRITITNPLVGR